MRSSFISVRGYFKYLVLYILSEGPLHGYGIMRKISELFKLGYVPSSGILYPTLKMLEKEGLIRHRVEGRRRVYELTSKGKEVLEEHRDEIEEFIDRAKHAREVVEELGLGRVFEVIRELWNSGIKLPNDVKEEIKKHIEEIYAILKKLISEASSTPR